MNINSLNNDFYIPEEMILLNKNTSYYMSFHNIKGNLIQGNVYSDKYFAFQDHIMHINGDNIQITNNLQNYKINGNFYFMYIKNNGNIFEMKSNIFYFFKLENLSILEQNIDINEDESNITAQYGKLYLDNNKTMNNDFTLKKAFFINKVNTKLKDYNISSDAIFLDKVKNIIMFYGNVIVIKDNKISRSNFYIYDMISEIGEIINEDKLNNPELLEIFNDFKDNIIKTPIKWKDGIGISKHGNIMTINNEYKRVRIIER
jgi:lipopolysaccharide export system protein LptA